jgi:hypothetical protein
MGMACSKHEGGGGLCTGIWLESQKERERCEDICVGRRKILRWILEKFDGVVWTEFVWLRIGISDGLLRAR